MADDFAEVRRGSEAFFVRLEDAGTPQGLGMASWSLSLLRWFWVRFVLRDRSWHIRVRRFHEDPAGPVLHHEVFDNRADAQRRLPELIQAIKRGELPLEA